MEKMFAGRKLVIATKHEKEKVIAPLLENNLGVQCFAAGNFDTDTLGTFTGEVERQHDPVTTLRNKCLLAMELNQCDLGVASEGSFGPHPALVFVPADDELVMLIDTKNNLEIIARELSTETNFKGSEIQNENELLGFAKNVSFPSHALILRKAKDDNTGIIKGITQWGALKKGFNQLQREYGTVYTETDMRAMYNPTRMQVIKQATAKLIAQIQSLCPQCSTPGFAITEVKQGLPCLWCGSATLSTLSHVYVCRKCNYTLEKKYPNNKTSEEPMYCQTCNP